MPRKSARGILGHIRVSEEARRLVKELAVAQGKSMSAITEELIKSEAERRRSLLLLEALAAPGDKQMNVIFFPSGRTLIISNRGRQIPNPQSWLLLYAEFLESQGIDPTQVDFILTDGQTAKVFKANGGYDWKVLGFTPLTQRGVTNDPPPGDEN
jgi:hypothetical protein